MFDRLDEVRELARARAAEDFEYFANTVLALRLSSEVCTAVQREFELTGQVALRDEDRVRRAVEAWLVVLGKTQGSVEGLSSTFYWLFSNELKVAA